MLSALLLFAQGLQSDVSNWLQASFEIVFREGIDGVVLQKTKGLLEVVRSSSNWSLPMSRDDAVKVPPIRYSIDP